MQATTAERSMAFPKNATLGVIGSTSKGVKVVSIQQASGEALTFRPSEPLRVLFEPSAFKDPTATRVNLVMQASPDTQEYLQGLDDWVRQTIRKNGQLLFKKDIGNPDEYYKPSLITSEKYEPSFKVKINLGGPRSVRCWTPDKEAREAPAAWAMCNVIPLVTARSLWLQSKECGVCLECTDVLIYERTLGCPF